MSQKKVDEYKLKKKNRQKLMRRERMLHRLELSGLLVVLIGLLSWFSVSVYRQVRADKIASGKVAVSYLDTSAIEEYMQSLSQTSSQTTP